MLADLDAHLQRQRSRLTAAGLRVDAALEALLLASDFAVDVLCRQPEGAAELRAPHIATPALQGLSREDAMRALRRWRALQSARLVYRDVNALDSVEQTLAGSSRIADLALQAALQWIETDFQTSFGVCRSANGEPLRLIVFGLGKLGGQELNFSSDVDLVYAYAEGGESDGARSLDAEAYFTRQGQALFKLMDEVTADGFVHRMDLRLRPFGASGRLVYSAAAMDQYFQREGRDWERYAWLKARCVAGDIAQGDALLDALRPFVYRRYLDYTALDGLREMKALIAAEVERKELADDLKRGPGGIREIEFLVQAQQLIRGGREPALQQRGLLPALYALQDAGHLPARDAQSLADAYRFLRRVENRVQMLADAQTHALPQEPTQRERIALSLGYASSAAFHAALQDVRTQVSEAFAELLQAPKRRSAEGAWSRYWQQVLAQDEDPAPLQEAGFCEPVHSHAALLEFSRSAGVRQLTARARQRLDHVLPALLTHCAKQEAPDAALRRCLQLLKSVLRRTTYLALLEEQPVALERMVELGARSAWMAERLAAHPLLFDELLDVRAAGPVPDAEAIAQMLTGVQGDDAETRLHQLNEIRQSVAFRLAVAWQSRRVDAVECARRLAHLAQALLSDVVALAREDVRRMHGVIEGASFAAIGYGSLGGEELGFNSDLDVVFLFDAPNDAESDGARPLDASRYFTRCAQKVVSLLQLMTPAGRLYEIDLRLRPDGSKGLPVIALSSFADYQRERAWTWEHQALVRARGVAGDEALIEKFDAVREEVLRRPREVEALHKDVADMRQRMRTELDRSDAQWFDLKQGEGGLVDLEFLLQYQVLAHAHQHPLLCQPRNSAELLQALASTGLMASEQVAALGEAHGGLLQLGLGCTLELAPRRVRSGEKVDGLRERVRGVVLR